MSPLPPPLDDGSAADLHQQARVLLTDLHQPNQPLYWLDFLASSLLGWGAFALAVANAGDTATASLCVAISVPALYRSLCFLHEIDHLRAGWTGRFEFAYNLFAGVGLLMPSFVYKGVHGDHHKLSTYGTQADPEYMPFSSSQVMTIVFLLQSLLIPLFLLLRFLVVGPLGLLVPPLHRWIVVHASSLTMNISYRRDVTPELTRKVTVWELAILAIWGGALALAATGWLPWRAFALWYAVLAASSFLNTLRTLVAHRYESDGEPLDRTGQLLDSIDTPGSWWTALWAPVGLRYHALHHYFPGIPYHNLATAHRALREHLPGGSPYLETLSPSLGRSLIELCRRGRRSRSGEPLAEPAVGVTARRTG